MSLLGLIRHLARVEHHWFERVLRGHIDQPRLYRLEDDNDWDFNGAVGDDETLRDALDAWKGQIARANEWLDEVPESALGSVVASGQLTVSVRDVLVHLIEEYARHAGHADLLRECIDGRTGQ
jgi:uncharacterized damage-inducible protein DinB